VEGLPNIQVLEMGESWYLKITLSEEYAVFIGCPSKDAAIETLEELKTEKYFTITLNSY
jgi:hypothetical protein